MAVRQTWTLGVLAFVLSGCVHTTPPSTLSKPDPFPPTTIENSDPLEQFGYVRHAAIAGHNRRHLPDATPRQCARACLTETSFVCKSFDYYATSFACDLSDKTADSVGGLKTNYPANPYEHYYRLQ
ncbi:MAG: PAN/Apple domain-containing protein [Rhodospirillaceae bacterium]